MNIIIEKNIPFIKGLLERFGEVQYLSADDITTEAVRDADALFVRTRTRCDSRLLDGSKCRFIATATIGTDHIDIPWCRAHGIEVANAPGCNAPAVAQYVFASILAVIDRPISQYTLGIVGVGHVGSIVEEWAHQMGMRVLVNDPPRQAAEGSCRWSSLDAVARQADIITFHTPLDSTTRHLVDDNFLRQLRRKPILINAARGGIVDTPALIAALEHRQVHKAIIDCWENEPTISPRLLQLASIATPHIAGYSYEGKVRATRMALDAFARHFATKAISMPETVAASAAAHVTAAAIASSYSPLSDTDALKSSPAAFESLRNTYALRHEVTPS